MIGDDDTNSILSRTFIQILKSKSIVKFTHKQHVNVFFFIFFYPGGLWELLVYCKQINDAKYVLQVMDQVACSFVDFLNGFQGAKT